MRTMMTLAAALTVSAALAARAAQPAPAKAADDAKTQAGGLYPNDFGPDEIDVSEYPKEMRASYKLFKFKCAACHTIARPINSQFLELSKDEIAKLKKEDPAALADERVLSADEGMWSRYVKRMMAKPGCPVGKDGKVIYEFLVYDSKARKTGINSALWRKHRKHLLHEYAEKYASSYKTLFGDKPAPAEEK